MLDNLQQKTTFLCKRYRFQILATMAVHVMTFTHGIGIGWLSPSLRLLQSEQSPLTATVSNDQASWIGSLIGLGAVVGNILFGLLLDRIGRKWCMYLLALPIMAYWVLVYIAQNICYLYVGRFLAGITGGGIYVVIPIFVSEIADNSIRGALSSMAMLYLAFGMLNGLILSSYVSYYLMPCLTIVLPIFYILAILGLCETPQYLLKKGKIDEAKESYNYYKNISNVAQIHDKEAQLQTSNNEFEMFRQQILKGGADQQVEWSDFFNKNTMKTFGIIIVLLITNQFSGSFGIFSYTSQVFGELGTTMDPNTCTIIVGLSQILGTICAILLVDRCGRRVLFLTSTAGMGLGMFSVGLFKQFASVQFFEKFDWLPLILFCFVAFISAVGVISLIFVIVVELLPAKIRSITTSIFMAILSVFVFMALKMYPLLISLVGLPITLYIASSICLFGFVFLGLFLPETKNKSMTD